MSIGFQLVLRVNVYKSQAHVVLVVIIKLMISFSPEISILPASILYIFFYPGPTYKGLCDLEVFQTAPGTLQVLSTI